ncbi:MAG: pyrroloquinoline quinone-dependent dehydrogenase [bacterium]
MEAARGFTANTIAAAVGILAFAHAGVCRAQGPTEWAWTEGAPGGGRYSPLADINRDNVGQLRVAWTYRHGDVYDGGMLPDHVNKGTSFEGTPIVVDGRLIFTTPYNRVIALDPESGRELWTFDPHIDTARRFANMLINRGVAYWRDEPRSGACARRVFFGTLDARLIALDAASGRPCADFGAAGEVNLLAGLTPVVDAWEYNVTSPPTVVGDVVVVGASIADTLRRVAPPGDVRAYDARSGALRWTFHTIPRPGELGNDTWQDDSWRNAGAANVWSTITADPARGLIFLPVSTPSPDFDGADRPGANLFSDSVVALRAATGEYVWHYQTVHHDLWDYDLAAPPVLADVAVGADGSVPAASRPAVIQATKAGFVFVLDRDTGAPLLPVEERVVPASDLPGEQSWPTQPVPLRPPPLLPAKLDAADLWDADAKRLTACRAILDGLRNQGVFTPPSLQGTLLYPMTGGGVNWSGIGVDPRTHRAFVPLNNLAHILRLTALPAWNVSAPDTIAPLHFFEGLYWAFSGRGTGLRYWTDPLRGRRIFSVDGVPCNRPPWGELVAVDLDRGNIAWRVPAGSDNGVQGLAGYGPVLVTAGGLVFHAGTTDLHLRAHDVDSGAVVAQLDLPAGLHAGPITYKLRPDGKQFLVIAPGGHIGLGSKQGDYVIAYTLP